MWLGQGPASSIGVDTDYHHVVKWVFTFELSGDVSQCSVDLAATLNRIVTTLIINNLIVESS